MWTSQVFNMMFLQKSENLFLIALLKIWAEKALLRSQHWKNENSSTFEVIAYSMPFWGWALQRWMIPENFGSRIATILIWMSIFLVAVAAIRFQQSPLGHSLLNAALFDNVSTTLESWRRRQLCWFPTAIRLIAVMLESPVKQPSLATSCRLGPPHRYQ